MFPVVFSYGSFFIPSYGVVIAVGILVAMWLASFRARQRGLPVDRFYDLVFIAILSGFLGGRVFYILLNFEDFLKDPMALILSRSGFVFLGGFAGAMLALYFAIQRFKLPLLPTADVLIVSLCFAHGFGRIACWAAGCCFGGVCTIPALSVQFTPKVMPGTENSPGGPEFFYNAFEEHQDLGLIPPDALASLPVWPVQLMEAIGLFILGAILWWYADSKPRQSGFVLAFYMIAYGLLRFSLEFLRGDLERGLFLGVSTSQWISLGLIPLGVILLYFIHKLPLMPHSHKSLSQRVQLDEDQKPKRFTAAASAPNPPRHE